MDFYPEQYDKRYKNERREYDYHDARKAALKRDEYTCRMCNKTHVKLEVHHILEYGKFYSVRTDLNNLITLCKACHKSIKGKESHYVEYFKKLIK